MIGAEDDELSRRHARCERALERCDLGGDFFETAERADRLGLRVDGSLEVVGEGWGWNWHLSRLMRGVAYDRPFIVRAFGYQLLEECSRSSLMGRSRASAIFRIAPMVRFCLPCSTRLM